MEERWAEQVSEEIGLGNKWSNRRYEQPGLGDQVEEAGRIGVTKVALNYDLVDSAFEPGVTSKLLCNSTNSMLANR